MAVLSGWDRSGAQGGVTRRAVRAGSRILP